jgi:hypothetical protein
LKVPLKARIFLWLALANKALTWENLQKRSWSRSGLCFLCREKGESMKQLLVSCHHTLMVWDVVKSLLDGKGSWHGDSLEEAFESWLDNKEVT